MRDGIYILFHFNKDIKVVILRVETKFLTIVTEEPVAPKFQIFTMKREQIISFETFLRTYEVTPVITQKTTIQ